MVTDTHEQAVIDAVPKELFVGGDWRPAASGKTFAVEDPATGDALCDVADGDATDAMAALGAACGAGGAPAGGAGRDPAPTVRAAHRAHRRSRPPHAPRDGQAGR